MAPADEHSPKVSDLRPPGSQAGTSSVRAGAAFPPAIDRPDRETVLLRVPSTHPNRTRSNELRDQLSTPGVNHSVLAVQNWTIVDVIEAELKKILDRGRHWEWQPREVRTNSGRSTVPGATTKPGIEIWRIRWLKCREIRQLGDGAKKNRDPFD